MRDTQVGVVATGTANLASVLAALRRLGATPVVVDRAVEVAGFDRIVLPGVGAFGAAMHGLRERGLDESLRQHVASGRPFLAICLGMQLLTEESEEAPGIAGLGVIRARVLRLPGIVRVPQLGWNEVVPTGEDLVTRGWAYFANSYACADVCASSGWTPATTVHGVSFVSALSRGPQLACQFHPELSGAWGAALLQDWWKRC